MLVLLQGVRVASARVVLPLVVPSGRDLRCASSFRVIRGVRAVFDGHRVRLSGLVLVETVHLMGPVVGIFTPGRGFWFSHTFPVLGTFVTEVFVGPHLGFGRWLRVRVYSSSACTAQYTHPTLAPRGLPVAASPTGRRSTPRPNSAVVASTVLPGCSGCSGPVAPGRALLGTALYTTAT